MKVVYKGKYPVAIPNAGEFKPNEPVEVPDDIAWALIEQRMGFEKVCERPAKRVKKNKEEDKGG